MATPRETRTVIEPDSASKEEIEAYCNRIEKDSQWILDGLNILPDKEGHVTIDEAALVFSQLLCEAGKENLPTRQSSNSPDPVEPRLLLLKLIRLC